MFRLLRIAGLVAVVAVTADTALADAPNILIGKWKLTVGDTTCPALLQFTATNQITTTVKAGSAPATKSMSVNYNLDDPIKLFVIPADYSGFEIFNKLDKNRIG